MPSPPKILHMNITRSLYSTERGRRGGDQAPKATPIQRKKARGQQTQKKTESLKGARHECGPTAQVLREQQTRKGSTARVRRCSRSAIEERRECIAAIRARRTVLDEQGGKRTQTAEGGNGRRRNGAEGVGRDQKKAKGALTCR